MLLYTLSIWLPSFDTPTRARNERGFQRHDLPRKDIVDLCVAKRANKSTEVSVGLLAFVPRCLDGVSESCEPSLVRFNLLSLGLEDSGGLVH